MKNRKCTHIFDKINNDTQDKINRERGKKMTRQNEEWRAMKFQMKVHKCEALATIASIYVVYAITTNDRNGNGYDNQMCIYAMSAVVAEGKRNRGNGNKRKKIHSHRDFNAYIHWLQPTPIYIATFCHSHTDFSRRHHNNAIIFHDNDKMKGSYELFGVSIIHSIHVLVRW